MTTAFGRSAVAESLYVLYCSRTSVCGPGLSSAASAGLRPPKSRVFSGDSILLKRLGGAGGRNCLSALRRLGGSECHACCTLRHTWQHSAPSATPATVEAASTVGAAYCAPATCRDVQHVGAANETAHTKTRHAMSVSLNNPSRRLKTEECRKGPLRTGAGGQRG